MTSRSSRHLAVLVSALIVLSTASAAERIQLDRSDDSTPLAVLSGANAMAQHAQLANLPPGSTLQPLRRYTDAAGVDHIRYQQLHRGIPVFGEHIVVAQTREGHVQSLSGVAVAGLEADLAATSPRLSAARSMQVATRQALGTRAGTMRVQDTDSRLMIHLDDRGTARLAWVNRFFADLPDGGAPTRPHVVVDAVDGRILAQWDGLAFEKSGTGPGGNLKAGKIEYGAGTRPLLDVTVDGASCSLLTPQVLTINLNHGTSARDPFSYTCPRNIVKEINGAYAPLNDAHHGGGVVFAMYNQYLQVDPLSFQLRLRVHYASNYENAFWDGRQMTFGDGRTLFYPLISLDVVAHEVSHGFTEQNSGLIYAGQSGGMNEAFSDIAGEAAEYFATGSNDFKVGETIFKEPGKALRYMEDPTLDGRSIDHASKYYSGLGVHYSSGVYNRAFHLLATTEGWDVEKAFKAFGKANTDHWTPSTTFALGACGVSRAATALGYAAEDVVAAFAEVGVSCPL